MFKNFKDDLAASVVVFFVAVPLCLGIALASGAPLFAGIIAGIVGGIIVGVASGSPLGVSGPAAGLAVIVFAAIESLGAWEVFLVSVVLAGVIQLAMGFAKAGFIAFFFPSSVIKGMLSGIGILIILKQIPHALGYDKDPDGDFAFFQIDGETTISALGKAVEFLTPGAMLISVISLLLLIFWDTVLVKKHKIFQLIQGPIVVVFLGILMNYMYQNGILNFSLAEDSLVKLPVSNSFGEFLGQFTMPDFSAITQLEVWKVAFVLAIVASLETLLCVEATDKLDPYKRVTPTNRELKAQGLGNMVSGIIGGLPVTQVIVRSSANIAFGGKTKLSAILHGVFLLISAFTLVNLLNMIPLASLAAILIIVGYKLAKPELFKQMYSQGWEQFIPFIMTILGILATDLLIGISIGMAFGVLFTLHHSYRNSYYMKDVVTADDNKETHHLVLAEEVSFFNKAGILNALDSFPENSKVIIDCSNSKAIARDVVEIIENYLENAVLKNITVEVIEFHPEAGIKQFNVSTESIHIDVNPEPMRSA
jgi:SulP family sulfate permease